MKLLNSMMEGKNYQSSLAAGALLVSKETKKCLVGLRSAKCDAPHTWGPFGGSIEAGETIKEGLLRELKEEIGFTGDVELHESWTFKKENFKYHTFIGLVDKEFKPKLNDETDDVKWLTLEELIDLPKKHHGFAEYVKEASDDLEKYMKKDSINEDVGGKKAVYHGTPDKRFDVLARYGGGKNDVSTGDSGVLWFTDNYHCANSYADPKRAFDYQNCEPGVIQRFIKCKNPLVVDAKGALWRKMNLNINGTLIQGTRELVQYAKENGHDGVCIKNVYDNYNHFKGENLNKKYLANTYAVFTDDQVSQTPHLD